MSQSLWQCLTADGSSSQNVSLTGESTTAQLGDLQSDLWLSRTNIPRYFGCVPGWTTAFPVRQSNAPRPARCRQRIKGREKEGRVVHAPVFLLHNLGVRSRPAATSDFVHIRRSRMRPCARPRPRPRHSRSLSCRIPNRQRASQTFGSPVFPRLGSRTPPADQQTGSAISKHAIHRSACQSQDIPGLATPGLGHRIVERRQHRGTDVNTISCTLPSSAARPPRRELTGVASEPVRHWPA